MVRQKRNESNSSGEPLRLGRKRPAPPAASRRRGRTGYAALRATTGEEDGAMARATGQAAVSAGAATEPSWRPGDTGVVPFHQMWKARLWEVNE